MNALGPLPTQSGPFLRGVHVHSALDVTELKPIPNVTSLWREFAAIATNSRRPSALVAAGFPEGERYPLANGPVSSIIVPLVLVGLFGDVPLSLVIVALCHPSHPMLIHAALATVGLLSLAWAIAARSAMRSIPHVVTTEALWIGGIRFSGVVPKAAIERVLAVQVSRHEWMSELGLGRDQVILASGFDPPNLAVEMKVDATRLVTMGGRHALTAVRRWILLYADSPAALIEATTPSAVPIRSHDGNARSEPPICETQ